MSSNAIFIHELKNEIHILKLLVGTLDFQNETIDRINTIINKINEKIVNAFNKVNEEKMLINVNSLILDLKSDYPNLHFNKELLESISFMGQKSEFQNSLTSIIKNSYESGATLISFEIKFNSLTIRDNGDCSIETVEKLNSKTKFTTKEDGSGYGSLGLHKFCEDNGCDLVYFLSQRSTSNGSRKGLAVRIKFPVVKKRVNKNVDLSRV
jgi:hypothetical protein